MTHLVTIDLGAHACALASWFTQELAHAALVGGLGGWGHPLLDTAQGVLADVRPLVEALGKIDELVIEVPQIYATEHQKGDQGDLIDLAIVGGGIAGALRAAGMMSPVLTGGGTLFIRPAEHKGQVPKPKTVKEPYTIETRARGKLTAEELSRIILPAPYKAHNVWDAINIGLWRIGR